MKTSIGLAILFSTLSTFSQSITFTTETISTSESSMLNKVLEQTNSKLVTYTKGDQYLSVMAITGYTMTQLQKKRHLVHSKF
jgi:hypothetical protein